MFKLLTNNDTDADLGEWERGMVMVKFYLNLEA